ncbi:MAG: type II toxin-antitoxin system VapC family toxin [Planctomycetia bacterium]|nr:type II toxin-antitoxin system VapC family toxin [Planctomycetia bacterium]
MKAVFADTFFYLALLNERDEAHQQALELSRRLKVPVITTTWVLTEVGDALAAPAHRPIFLALVADLERDRAVTIVPPTRKLFDERVKLFGERRDKGWSLTDCVSFVVMDHRGLSEALTGDHHFEQAGFSVLM